jgi:hypothetical protein
MYLMASPLKVSRRKKLDAVNLYVAGDTRKEAARLTIILVSTLDCAKQKHICMEILKVESKNEAESPLLAWRSLM